MTQFNQENFDQDLSSGKKLYIYHYLSGCGPCKNITPHVEDFSAGRDNVYFITPSDQAEIPTDLHPGAYPTLFVIENNFVLKKLIGQSDIINELKNG